MKHLLLLFSALLISCSNDSGRQAEPNENCNCFTIIAADTFSLPNGATWTVATMENDCTGAQKQRNIDGVHSVGEKQCD